MIGAADAGEGGSVRQPQREAMNIATGRGIAA